MGYDLHITRARRWNENEGRHIPALEWLDVCDKDRDLVADPEFGPYAAKWTGSDADGWLDWQDGNVYTTDPDRPMVAKMLRFAKQLEARVQGDGGEWYESPEQWTPEQTS